MNSVLFVRELAATFWEDLTCAFSFRNWTETTTKLTKLTKKQMLQNSLWILPQLALFYGLLSPVVAMPLYNKMLFFPAKELAYDFHNLHDVPKEDVFFPSTNKANLHAWYFQVPDSRGTAIISHGNAGNISYRVHLIDLLMRNKLSVLAYDYQGYGKSEGSPSIENVCADGLAAYDYLTNVRKVDPQKVIVYGESLGGGVTSYIATHRKVGAIILQSTFSSIPHVAKEKMLLMKFYPRFLFPKNCLDSASWLSAQHAPLLIVHGKNDTIIPFSEAEVLFKEAAEPKQLAPLESANHNDVYVEYKEDLDKVLAKFINSVL